MTAFFFFLLLMFGWLLTSSEFHHLDCNGAISTVSTTWLILRSFPVFESISPNDKSMLPRWEEVLIRYNWSWLCPVAILRLNWFAQYHTVIKRYWKSNLIEYRWRQSTRKQIPVNEVEKHLRPFKNLCTYLSHWDHHQEFYLVINVEEVHSVDSIELGWTLEPTCDSTLTLLKIHTTL